MSENTKELLRSVVIALVGGVLGAVIVLWAAG